MLTLWEQHTHVKEAFTDMHCYNMNCFKKKISKYTEGMLLCSLKWFGAQFTLCFLIIIAVSFSSSFIIRRFEQIIGVSFSPSMSSSSLVLCCWRETEAAFLPWLHHVCVCLPELSLVKLWSSDCYIGDISSQTHTRTDTSRTHPPCGHRLIPPSKPRCSLWSFTHCDANFSVCLLESCGL